MVYIFSKEKYINSDVSENLFQMLNL